MTETPRNNSQIVQRLDGKFYAETGIQDGTERSGPLGSLKEAQDWCKQAERVMNGNKVKRKHIPFYVE